MGSFPGSQMEDSHCVTEKETETRKTETEKKFSDVSSNPTMDPHPLDLVYT